MALIGHKRSCDRQSGGINSIDLFYGDDIVEVTYDFASGEVYNIALVDGATSVEYHFNEGEAIYSEQVVCSVGLTLVRHQLSFTMERMDAASIASVEELAKASNRKLMAIVTTANGISMLVGHSEKFGSERGLTLSIAHGTTGATRSDRTSEIVTLRSEDCSKATTIGR